MLIHVSFKQMFSKHSNKITTMALFLNSLFFTNKTPERQQCLLIMTIHVYRPCQSTFTDHVNPHLMPVSMPNKRAKQFASCMTHSISSI